MSKSLILIDAHHDTPGSHPALQLIFLQSWCLHRNWEDLTDEQRNAAKVLGYTKRNWDGKGKTKYENYDWKELPEDAKEAAKKLGYTKKMWDADEGW